MSNGTTRVLDPQADPDMQEALSIRQSVSLRVARLSSGTWALFPENGSLLLCRPLLNIWKLTELADAERAERQGRWDRYEAWIAAGQPEARAAVTELTPEDLGL